MNNKFSPAFPPQLMMDNFQQLVAPVPGMSKFEFAAILLFPIYVKMGEEAGLTEFDFAVDQTIDAVKKLFEELEKEKPETNNDLKIVQ